MIFAKHIVTSWKSESVSFNIPKFVRNNAQGEVTGSNLFRPNALKIYRKEIGGLTSDSSPSFSSSCPSSLSTQTIRQIEFPNGYFTAHVVTQGKFPKITINAKDIRRDVNSNCFSADPHFGSCNNSLARVRNRKTTNNLTNQSSYFANNYTQHKKDKYLKCLQTSSSSPQQPQVFGGSASTGGNHTSSHRTFRISHECSLDHDCYKATVKKNTSVQPCKPPLIDCTPPSINLNLFAYATSNTVELRWTFDQPVVVDILQNGEKIATQVSIQQYFISGLTPKTSYKYTLIINTNGDTNTVLSEKEIKTMSNDIQIFQIPTNVVQQSIAVNYDTSLYSYVDDTSKSIKVYKTGDISVYTPTPNFPIELTKASITSNYVGDYIYCTDGNKAVYSNDYGVTWTEISLDLPPSVNEGKLLTTPFSVKSDNTGMNVCLLSEINNYSLLLSTDGGKTYQLLFDNLLGDPVDGGEPLQFPIDSYKYPTIIAMADFSVIFVYASVYKTFLSSQVFVIDSNSVSGGDSSLYSLINVNSESDSIGSSRVSVNLEDGKLYFNNEVDNRFTNLAVVYKDQLTL